MFVKTSTAGSLYGRGVTRACKKVTLEVGVSLKPSSSGAHP